MPTQVSRTTGQEPFDFRHAGGTPCRHCVCQIRLEPGTDGSLWAAYEAQPAVLMLTRPRLRTAMRSNIVHGVVQ